MFDTALQEKDNKVDLPSQKRPLRCPVCEGRGTVPKNFYSCVHNIKTYDTTEMTCRACLGTGVIWG